MTYDESLRWLYSLQPRGIRLELDRMRAACALRGDPQRALRVVHVAGTNGKGSVCAMIESALRAAGVRTGLYTSPHLHSFRERIRIAGEPIAEDEVATRVTALRAMLETAGAPELTFFEVATLLALEAFRDAGCELVVLEVGLGGRLDATNVIDAPLVTVLTSVALDHQSYLGTTIEAIAREKAGILKRGVSAVIGRVGDDAWRVIEARARELGAPLSRAGETASTPALAGAHQRDNAAVAIEAVERVRARGVPMHDDAIRRGLADVRWPGRLERIAGEPEVLVDAAHNPDGARALAAHLASLPRAGRRVLVFGAMADKDWRAMLDALRPEVDEVIGVAPAMPRAERAEAIAEAIGGSSAASIREGVDRARERAGSEGLVVVAGSIFVLAEARAHLLGIESEPAIPL